MAFKVKFDRIERTRQVVGKRRDMLKTFVRNIHWCAVAVVLSSCLSTGFSEKGFVAVEDLKTDVILILADGRKVALGKALPEYEPTFLGAPLPIEELRLDRVPEVWLNMVQPFDYNQDHILEKPEIAVIAIALSAKNKGLNVINVAVNGSIVNGLDVTLSQDYGLEALIRKVPARDAAGRKRKKMMLQMGAYFNALETTKIQ